MHTTSFLIILVPVLLAVPFVLIPRRRMEQRARALLAQHPNAELTSIYLAFRSGWTGKRAEMDAKIAEMARGGWTFLRASEASPLRTIRSWGGGLTLHFIRVHSTELQA
jgi:hypothetical protein